jgi:hypothetical protein
MPPLTQWTLIVIRAWIDSGGIRVRMLNSDAAGHNSEAVVSSLDDVTALVSGWLDDLATGGARSGPDQVGGHTNTDPD